MRARVLGSDRRSRCRKHSRQVNAVEWIVRVPFEGRWVRHWNANEVFGISLRFHPCAGEAGQESAVSIVWLCTDSAIAPAVWCRTRPELLGFIWAIAFRTERRQQQFRAASSLNGGAMTGHRVTVPVAERSHGKENPPTFCAARSFEVL